MRRLTAAIAIVIMFLAVPMLCTADSDGAPSKPEMITIYGYVADVSNEQGNSPLSGVQVSILSDVGAPAASSCETDEAGMFEFTFEKDTISYISFSLDGYTVRSYGNALISVEGDSNLFRIDYSEAVRGDDGRYAVSGDPTEGSFIGMGITKWHVFGYVLDQDGKGIVGATVTVTGANGKNIYGTTNGDGYFDIECFYGTYTLSASCSGFQSSGTFTVNVNDPMVSITLEERDHSLFLGLDTPHAMEIVGAVCILTLAAIFGLAYWRVRSGASDVEVVVDLDDDKNRKDDEIRDL